MRVRVRLVVAVGTVVLSVIAVGRRRRVRMVRIMVRRRRMRVMRTVFVHLASMAVPETLEALELLPSNRQPSAQYVRAFVDIVLRAVQILGQALVDLGHKQTALVILDELDLDAGNAVDEGRANLDDLKLDLDKLELAVGVLLARANLQAKAKALRLGCGRRRALAVTVAMVAVMSMLPVLAVRRLAVAAGIIVLSVIAVGKLAVTIGTVTMGRLAVAIGTITMGRLAVAVGTVVLSVVTVGRLVVPVGAVVFTVIAMGRLPVPVATTVVMVVISVVPLHPLVPLNNLWRREGLVQRVARRIQLEAVDEETVMVGLVVDGEGQFEMVRAMDLELETLLWVLAALHQNRAAWTFDVDDLALGDLRADALDGVGNLDVGLADLGREEECLGRWKSQKARRDREGFQQHRVGGDGSRMVRYEGVSSITARAGGVCRVCLMK